MSRFWKIALIVIAVIVVAAIGFRLMHKPAAEGGYRHGAHRPRRRGRGHRQGR